MYNEELKRQFIKSYTDSLHTETVARTIFDAIEPYEKQWGADMCTRSTAELQPVIDDLLGIRMRSKWMSIIILREYAKWCMLAKYPGACNGIMEVNMIGLEKIKKQMVASPLHLQRYLDEIFDPVREETIDITYRCHLWMAYGGISDEDSLSVRVGDVNLEDLRINVGDTEAPIYREALPAFKSAITLTSFSHRHPHYKRPVRKDRVAGDTIMRGVKADAHLLTLRSALSRRLTEAAKTGQSKLQLSFYRIWLSGLFYRMYEAERAGFPVDFSAAAVNEMHGKTYSLTGRSTMQQKQNRKARDYAEDYQRWKLAFSI